MAVREAGYMGHSSPPIIVKALGNMDPRLRIASLRFSVVESSPSRKWMNMLCRSLVSMCSRAFVRFTADANRCCLSALEELHVFVAPELCLYPIRS